MCLNILFLDMNAYFASVEQQTRPELRRRPVAVVPMSGVDTTCCIAVSYEARPYGIRTGTGVGQAKRLCPDLRLVEARPELYIRTHHRIVAAVDSCVPVAEIHSIDEMSCRLIGDERRRDNAAALARRIKRVLREDVGRHLRCSVGLAPNRVLAKTAAGMHKPDGLTVIARGDLPQKLYGLELADLPGIGPRMRLRLARHGVDTVEQLCGLSEARMTAIWASVVGSRWWRWLRGDEAVEPTPRRRTVGHSRVLPPDLRNDAGAHAVLVHLIHKASERLRRIGYWAGRMEVGLEFYDRPPWAVHARLGVCRDTLTMLEEFAALWSRRPRRRPMGVGVTLSDLVADGSAALPLFPEDQRRVRLAEVVDAVNARFGPLTLYFGAMHAARDAVPTRIAYTCIPEVLRRPDTPLPVLSPPGGPGSSYVPVS